MRAFLFPGQGSQYVGMGRELARRSPAARAVFEEVDAALGRRLSRTIWEGPDRALWPTHVCQPALLAVEVATLRALAERGVVPDALLGHSLGEYAALVAAGALPLADAARAVALRGRLMAEAVPVGRGGMCAVVGPRAPAVEALCAEVSREWGVLEIAAYNAPRQTCVAGESAALEGLLRHARERGYAAVRLATSGPFHTSLLREVGARLRRRLDVLPWSAPRVPYVANCDAAWVRDAGAIPARLEAQVHRPVRFEQGVRALLEAGVTAFVEVGPGRTLRGLVRHVARGATVRVTDAGREARALEPGP